MPTTLSGNERFFVNVTSLCKYETPPTCTPETSVLEAARIMRRHNVTGLVVVDNQNRPTGIVSVRGFRDLIDDNDGSVEGSVVSEIMTDELVIVKETDHVFNAILQMVRNNVHRLAVVNESGSLVCCVTDTDILTLQAQTPLYLHLEIETADSLDELKGIAKRMNEIVAFAAKEGADTRRAVQLISHFNDAFTQSAIRLIEKEMGPFPEKAAFIVMGSEGREEQTLRTDQDSALIYCDSATKEEVRQMESFCKRLVDVLEEIGVPRCPALTMASEKKWRKSFSEWKEQISLWIDQPDPKNLVTFGMFQDFRFMFGDQSLVSELREHLHETLKRNKIFLPHLARHVVCFRPQLSFFGGIKTEKDGEEKGTIELKKAGIFVLTRGISILALEFGVSGGSTWDKLEMLAERQALSAQDTLELKETFSFMTKLRLNHQLNAISQGEAPTNRVKPDDLSPEEHARLVNAMKVVSGFNRFLTEHYRLNFIFR